MSLKRSAARSALVLLCATTSIGVPSADLGAQTVIGRSSDITFGGRVHAQYFQTSVEDGPPKDLFFRRVRLSADIRINEYLDGRIMPDFAGGKTALQDVYLRLRVNSAFRIAIGQFKRAFDLFGLESSTQLPFAERDGRIPGLSACDGVGGTCSYTRLSEKLNFSGRDTGVRIDGSVHDRASYLVTITNGEGINRGDVNQGKSYAGRLVFDANDNTEIGLNLGVHDVFDEIEAETTYASAFAVDAKVGDYLGGPLLMASVMRGENWQAEDSSGNTATFWTGQVVGSYYAETSSDIFPGIEPALRLALANPNTDLTDASGFLVSPALHFYIQGRNRIGATLDVFSPNSGDTEFSLKLMSFLYF